MPTDYEQRLQEKYAKRRAKLQREAGAAGASGAADTTQPAASASPAAVPASIEVAKGVLAKQQAAKSSAQARPAQLTPKHPPIPFPAASSGNAAAPVDPMELAKRALAAQGAKRSKPVSAAPKRPTLKRPAPQPISRVEEEPPAQPPAQQPYSPTANDAEQHLHRSPHHHHPAHGEAASHRASGASPDQGAQTNGHRPPERGTVHVGEVPSWATDADLVDAFQPYGMISNAYIIPGACYGFVTFRDLSDAEHLLHTAPDRPPHLQQTPLTVAPAFHAAHAPPGLRPDPAAKKARPPTQSNHPKVQAAVAAAESLLDHPAHEYVANLVPPARSLVSYDDL